MTSYLQHDELRLRTKSLITRLKLRGATEAAKFQSGECTKLYVFPNKGGVGKKIQKTHFQQSTKLCILSIFFFISLTLN